MIAVRLLTLLLCVFAGLLRPLAAQDRPLFERDIAPILSAHCWKCHGMDDRKAGLDLRTPPLILKGSDKRPVIRQRSAAESVLYQKISTGGMPPQGEPKLRPEQIETIRKWIDAGAPFARTYDSLNNAEVGNVTESDRKFWAFRKPVRPPVPAIRRRSRVPAPIDAFVLAKLEEKKLTFAPEADAQTLIRRAYYDLTGLPPSPEEVDAFVADRGPSAFERLVDRLLASPHFGERWGRHWLDAAGYADVYGIDSNPGDIRTGEGKWRYRDYVVRAFNSDKPYNRFLTEQIAGDELVGWRGAKEYTPEIIEALEATGFLRTAADDTNNDALNTALIRYRVLNLTIQNLTSNVLGLTVACAQCHTHKYDPIPQRDYYRLLAIFTPSYNPQGWLQTKDRYLPDIAGPAKEETDRYNAQIDQQVKPLVEDSARLRKPYEQRMLDKKLNGLPEGLREDAKAAILTPVSQRTPIEQYLIRKLGGLARVTQDEAKKAMAAEDLARYDAIEAQVRALNKQKKSYGKVQALYDVGPAPPTHLLRRGTIETPAAEVEPGFLTVLTDPGKPVTISDSPSGPSSGRRLALTRWLVEPDTPASGLVARVMVNRIWQQVFGEGIVNPPDNFGKMGSPPTHPELLDWLATEFVRGGWRIKPMIRLMMNSSAYRQDSRRPDAEQAEAVDPGNHLLWRMRLRRLEAEAIRDSVLAASGKLDSKLGGEPVKMEYRGDGRVLISEKDLRAPTEKWRRSLYLFTRRSYNLNLLSVFDQPVMDANCARRNKSAVVLQSLAMLNDAFLLEQARYLAERTAQVGEQPEARIRAAFRLAIGRPPKPKEAEWTLSSLRQFKDQYRGEGMNAADSERAAFQAVCHTLLNTNEFLYIR